MNITSIRDICEFIKILTLLMNLNYKYKLNNCEIAKDVVIYRINGGYLDDGYIDGYIEMTVNGEYDIKMTVKEFEMFLNNLVNKRKKIIFSKNITTSIIKIL